LAVKPLSLVPLALAVSPEPAVASVPTCLMTTPFTETETLRSSDEAAVLGPGDEDPECLADAAHGVTASAAPMPNATAKSPTRPMN
jgi:hypothetical protein